jgi:hypothetical protein
MTINQRKHNVRDWVIYETDQIKAYDDAIQSHENKKKLMDYAYLSKNSAQIYIFEDNFYKDIEEKHLRCFEILYTNFLLNVQEQLENDIITIEKYHNHLHKFRELGDFEHKLEDLRKKNEINYKRIAELESRFLAIYDTLNEIKDIGKVIDNIDEEIENELAEVEKNKNLLKQIANLSPKK